MLTACELQQPEVAVMWGRRGTGLCCSLWVLPGLPSPSLTCCSLSLEASHCAEWKASVYLEQVGICCCTSSFCHFQPQGFSSSVFVVPGCAGGLRLGIKNNFESKEQLGAGTAAQGVWGHHPRGGQELWRWGTGGCGWWALWGWGSQVFSNLNGSV